MFANVLMLQCRGFGDAIIATHLINAMGQSWEGVCVDVWASPELVPLFEGHPFVNQCYVQGVPLIRRYKFSFPSVLGTLGRLFRLRAKRYDLCINLVGDVRENLLTWLVRAKSSWSIEWQEGHPFNQLVHPGLSSLIGHIECIPATERNVYVVYKRLAAKLGCIEAWGVRTHKNVNIARQVELGKPGCRIGIHPLAGVVSKEWPIRRWNELVKRLLERGCEVAIFGAPRERPALTKAFSAWSKDGRVSIETRSLRGFLEALKDLTAFVGLDSFGIHAAYSVGVPSVLLNGANAPDVWAPPGTYVLGEGQGCEHYPCYNRPKCEGMPNEFVCIRGVSVENVMGGLKAVASAATLHDHVHRQWEA